MNHRLDSLLPLTAAAALLTGLVLLTGCHTNHTGQSASCECFYNCYETPPCYGYHSTCWRPWPEECPSCPPYTLPAMPAEQVLPGPPLPGGPGTNPPAPAPAPPMPMPMPESAAPPQPMLQPATPAPAPAPAPSPGEGAAFPSSIEPQPGADEGQLRRRWVEGGFVSQPVYR